MLSMMEKFFSAASSAREAQDGSCKGFRALLAYD
jgi:hypothetical protein